MGAEIYPTGHILVCLSSSAESGNIRTSDIRVPGGWAWPSLEGPMGT